MNVTPTGIENLKDQIINRTVEPPRGMNASELIEWLNGYAKCQMDILDIIDELYSVHMNDGH